jgi:hypothetical protein
MFLKGGLTMAIDPATAKVLVTIAKNALTDEKTRKRIFVVLAIPIVVVLIILASPYAIIFASSGETVGDSGTSIIEVMNELSSTLNDKIQAEQDKDDTDEVKVIFMGSEGETINNSGHVLALFSVNQNMVESEDARQVASLSNKQGGELKELFWKMNSISTEVESIPWDSLDYPLEIPPLQQPTAENPKPQPTPTPRPYTIKHIYVTCLSYDDMLDEFSFIDKQLKVLEDMMTGEYAYIFATISGNIAELTTEEIAKIRASLPFGLSVQREQIVLTAYSLVGKVKYFWGGKSTAIGWDSHWGKPATVNGHGSPTYGTTRPFGLDCSGYVKWVYLNAGFPLGLLNDNFGTGSSHQWEYSLPVSKNTVFPGDLAFRIVPGTGVNHVGMVVGKDSSGTLMVAHCSSSRNGVVVTPFSPTFRYLRRPVILD